MLRRPGSQTQVAALVAAVQPDTEPLTVKEAKASPEWPQWQDTMQEEYKSLLQNNMFTPIAAELLYTDEVKPIGNK